MVAAAIWPSLGLAIQNYIIISIIQTNLPPDAWEEPSLIGWKTRSGRWVSMAS